MENNFVNYYPLFINLNKIKCLVIGGGEVAYRKTLSLKEAGAKITLISPKVIPAFLPMVEKGEINLIKRKYQKGDLKGYFLVFAALDDKTSTLEIAQEAEEAGILLNMAQNPDGGNFILPATLKRGELILAISTGGQSPALSKKIRQEFLEKYGPEYEEFLHLLGRERAFALRKIPEISKRKAYFEALAYSDLPDLIKAGEKEKINWRINKIRENFGISVCV
ncbi:MAG: precorrin-2 dehydrogenase/sirohydrochlorin ferrochelatase family protein [Bacillota bacterium]